MKGKILIKKTIIGYAEIVSNILCMQFEIYLVIKNGIQCYNKSDDLKFKITMNESSKIWW